MNPCQERFRFKCNFHLILPPLNGMNLEVRDATMNELPKRKPMRIAGYDYSAPGAYFITICTANREKSFWSVRRGELGLPVAVPLSDIGIKFKN